LEQAVDRQADERIKTNAPLNAPAPSTFFGGGPKGYADYPTLAMTAHQ
jgi:hypothetical protein